MKDKSNFAPLFKSIDKLFFGIEDLRDDEKIDEFMTRNDEEEFDVKRSIN